MTTKIIGRVCKCESCQWIGPHAKVGSMAGFEFCPSCKRRYVGFMPKSNESVQKPKEVRNG